MSTLLSNPDRYQPINQYQKTGKYIKTTYVDEYTDSRNIKEGILECCQRVQGAYSSDGFLWTFLRENPNCDNIAPYCNDTMSYGEKIVYRILRNAGIEFIPHYSTDWSQHKVYDFYIPARRMIIEVNGMQHYKYVPYYAKTLQEQQENDAFKKKLAEDNGIEHYIYIDARHSEFNFIKESVINSGLLNILGITDVDWKDVSEFSYKRADTLVTKMWNDGEHKSKKIAANLNMNESAVIAILKRYDSQLTPKYSETHFTPEKGVIQYTLDGKEIARFNSITEAAVSLGKKDSSGIRKCCNHFQKTSQGFRWEFVDPNYILKDRVHIESKRKINMYDLYQRFIRQFDDIQTASIELGIPLSGIKHTCKREQVRTRRYVFRYADDCDDIVEGEHVKHTNHRSIVFLDSDKQYFRTFIDSVEATEFLGVESKTTVTTICRTKSHRYKQYFIYYEDDYNKLINNQNMEVA